MKAANVTKTKSKKITGADKTPGGKTGGTNAPLKKQTVPKGKVGGTTKAPKKASPSCQFSFMSKELIKRKDGSYSQRGLWDNIRANKGSGKKPTKQMLKQEKKIKATTKKKK